MRNIIPFLLSFVLVVATFSCKKNNDGPIGGAGTLKDSSGNCLPKTIGGTYKVGQALTTANYIDVQVNVTSTGNYTISTAQQNGFGFTASQSFSSTGLTTVRLQGSGTPLQAGANIFVVTLGTSSCAVVVNVVPLDSYFPMTANSWWSYSINDSTNTAVDSIKTTNTGSVTLAGNTYQRYVNVNPGGTQDTLNYRLDAATGTIYLYQNLNKVAAGQATFSQPDAEFPVVKETLATGDSWSSAVYSGTASVGGFPIPVNVKAVFTCLSATATVTYNGHTFNNVYKVQTAVQASPAGQAYQTLTTVVNYYVKNIGMIYQNNGQQINVIRNWHIN